MVLFFKLALLLTITTVVFPGVFGSAVHRHRLKIRLRNTIIFSIFYFIIVIFTFLITNGIVLINFLAFYGIFIGSVFIASLSDEDPKKPIYWSGLIPGIIIAAGFISFLA